MNKLDIIPQMKLHWSPRSPYVRKVMILAHETGLAPRLSLVRTVVSSTEPHRELLLDNPLCKIPTLVLEDGLALFDSRVISEYLDGLHAGAKLFPAEGRARMAALRWQAMGDGLLDTLLPLRNERMKEAPMQNPAILAALETKVRATLDAMDKEAAQLAAAPYSIGQIAVGGALCYVDFRFVDMAWRATRPSLAAWHATFCERPAVSGTHYVEG